MATVSAAALGYAGVKPCGRPPYLENGKWIVGFWSKDGRAPLQVEVDDLAISGDSELRDAANQLERRINSVLLMAL